MTSGDNSLPFIGAEANLNQWKKRGITVKMISGTSSSVGPTLATGDADIGLGAGNTALADIAKGLPAKIVAGVLLPWDQYVIASKKSGATKPADLKGKAFGVSSFGSGGYYATLKMAESLGWSKKDYKVVQLGDLKGLVAGLKRGTIDSFLWSAQPAYNLQAEGQAVVLGSARDYVGPNVFEALVVPDKVLKEKPDAVKKFVKGYFDAVSQLQSDKSKALDILTNQWKENPEGAKNALDHELSLLSTDGKIPPQNLKGVAEAAKVTTGGKTNVGDPASFYTYWQDIGK